VFRTQQVSGPIAPLQVSGPSSYYPMQTSGTDWTSMISMMMPMIMMIMMVAMLMPMFKGITASARE